MVKEKEKKKGRVENLTTQGRFKDKKKASEAGKKGVKARREKKKITEHLKALLEEQLTINTQDHNGKDIKETKTGAEHVATVLLKKALSGDIRAIKEYIDRIEGQATQKMEIEETERPKKLEVVFVKRNKSEG